MIKNDQFLLHEPHFQKYKFECRCEKTCNECTAAVSIEGVLTKESKIKPTAKKYSMSIAGYGIGSKRKNSVFNKTNKMFTNWILSVENKREVGQQWKTNE